MCDGKRKINIHICIAEKEEMAFSEESNLNWVG